MVRLMRLNIEGLTCGVANGGDVSRLTMTVNGDDSTLDFVAKQLSKVIDVLDARTYTRDEVLARELAIVRISRPLSRRDAKKLRGAQVLDSSKKSITVEVVGAQREVDEFLHRFEGSQILDLSRTGTTAIPRKR